MRFRLVLSLFVCLSLSGCAFPIKRVHAKKKPDDKTREPAIKDAHGDTSFQAFIGRLRKVVAARDAQELATMMTPNFGYALTPDGEGEGVFKFWEQHDLWGELELVVRDKFVPHQNFMVSPPQFAADPDNYRGYRAGIGNYSGSWKFAYFVGGEE